MRLVPHRRAAAAGRARVRWPRHVLAGVQVSRLETLLAQGHPRGVHHPAAPGARAPRIPRAAPASEGVFAPVAATPRADPRVGLRAREVLRARRVGEKLVVVRPAECNFEKRQQFGIIFAVRASRQTGGWGRDGRRARGAPHPLRIESMSSAPDEESSPSSSAPPVSEPCGTALFNSPQSRPPLYQHGTGAAFNDHSQHPAQPKQRWPCKDRGPGDLEGVYSRDTGRGKSREGGPARAGACPTWSWGAPPRHRSRRAEGRPRPRRPARMGRSSEKDTFNDNEPEKLKTE
jgi:hypothetical protein